MNRLFGILALLILAASVIPNHTALASGLADNIQIRDVGERGVNLSWQLEEASSANFLSSFGEEQLNQITDDIEIPSVTRWVAVPPGHKVELQFSNNHSIRMDLTQDGAINSILAGELVRTDDLQLNPPSAAYAGDIVVVRGIPIVPIIMYPVQLGEDGTTAIENRNLNVSVEFVPDNSSTDFVTFNDLPNSPAARMMDNLLVNPPRRDPNEAQTEYLDHILILHQDDDNFMRQSHRWVDSLATWKRQIGYKVTTLAMDNETDGITIRNRIREYWEVEAPEIPISHVIIIGGDSPAKYLYFPTCPGTGDQIIGDHFYTILRRLGDNEKPIVSDITIGRFEAWSNGELAGEIMRSIWYERSPLREDENDDWFSKGIVAAERADFPGGQFVPSMVHLGRWIYTRLIQTGFTHVDTLWPDAADQTRRALEEGRSFAFSRGHLDGCLEGLDLDSDPIETDRRNPFIATVTCISFPRLDKFFRTGVTYNPARLDQLSGAVAGMGIILLTNTRVNTSLSSGIIRGMRYFDLNQPGLLQNFGKLQLASDYRYDPGLQDFIVETLAVFRLVGDPTLNCWTGTPTDLTVDHPEEISLGHSGLNVQVTAEGAAVPDAIVCISQVDGIHLVTFPGDDGVARFSFDPNDLSEGELVLTVTGQDLFPYVTAIDISGSGIDLETVDYNFDETMLLGEAVDNRDGMFGNGYSIPTSLTLLNSTQNDINDVTVSLSSEDDYISFDPAQFDLDQIGAGANAEVDFNLAFDRSSYGGRDVVVTVDLASGEQIWTHSFTLVTSGPVLEIDADALIGGAFDRGSVLVYEATIGNIGDLEAPRCSATIVSLNDESVNINSATATYPSINANDTEEPSGGRIRFTVDEFAIPGATYPFMLLIESLDDGDDYRDTLHFSKSITNHNNNDPFGPDDYGYLCFDSNDGRDWSKAPNYQWREINPAKPDFDFAGERLEIEVVGATRDPDSSAVVALPFTFQYYGQEFDTIVVCANGWMAFGGDQSMFVDFRNWQIPGNQGPDAQVCALWQDLVNIEAGDRGIFVHHIEEEGVYIIEWSEWGILGGPIDLMEFQIILYDESRWPTVTHDGDIKIQYKHVVMVPGEGTDNSFATIGIKNLDNTDGLEYSYWNQYPTGASEIEDEMSILFTTESELRVGVLSGRVVTYEDSSAVEDATVVVLPAGIETETDADGNFTIEDIPVGTSVVEVRLHGYNTFRQGGVEINEDQTTTLNMELTHPVMLVNGDMIDIGGLPLWGSKFDTLAIGNSGSGPLDVSLSTRHSNGDPVLYNQVNSNIPIGEMVNDDAIRGCQLVWGDLYVTGGNYHIEDGFSDTSLVNYIYVINSDGEEVRRFRQPSITTGGFWDLAWDSKSNVMYGGETDDFSSWLVSFDSYGNLIDRFVVNYETFGFPRALAFDPDSGTVYFANEDKDILEMFVTGDRAGEFRIHSFSLPGEDLWITGMAWNHLDKETPLYIMDQRLEAQDNMMRLIRYHPWTRKIRIIDTIEQDELEEGNGLTFGFDWRPGSHTMMTVGAAFGSVYDLDVGPDSRFISYDPGPYTVDPNGEQIVELTFDATAFYESLIGGRYEAGLHIEHNSAGNSVTIPVAMTVTDPVSVDEDDKILPVEFSLDQAYPNPFNSSTRIGFSLPETGLATLTVFDIAGREVARLADDNYSAGHHAVTFNALRLSSGIYFYRLESNGLSTAKRMVLVK